jgi:hypothetical protein
MVLTIRKASVATRPRATAACARSTKGSGMKFTQAATWAAAAGMGRPTK